LPDEKKPCQAISTCPNCGASVSQDTQECQSCHQVIIPKQGRPHPRKVPQKGERYKEYGPNHQFVNPANPVVASSKEAKVKKEKDHAEHDKTTVKDVFTTDFDQCLKPIRKNKRNDDVRKEDIVRSCTDLAIDG
jgi:hypothetical protein